MAKYIKPKQINSIIVIIPQKLSKNTGKSNNIKTKTQLKINYLLLLIIDQKYCIKI